MVFKERITAALRAYVVYKLEDGHKKARDIAKETGLSLASVYRIRKMNIQGLKSKPRNAGGPGRPKKLSNQTLRRLARGILQSTGRKSKLLFGERVLTYLELIGQFVVIELSADV